MIATEIPPFIVELEERFNRAVVSNDAEAIARCTTEDWILIDPAAGPIPRSRLLDVVALGRL